MVWPNPLNFPQLINSQFFQDHKRQWTRTHFLRLYVCWYIKSLPCLFQPYCQQTSLPHTQYKHERKVWKCPSNYLWDSASYLGYSCSSQDLKWCLPTNLPPWLSVLLKLYHLLFPNVSLRCGAIQLSMLEQVQIRFCEWCKVFPIDILFILHADP